MGKHKSKKILEKVFGYLIALELVAGSYVLINISQRNAKYTAGNGFPNSIVSKTSISPTVYKTSTSNKLLFYLPEPSQELMYGLEKDTIMHETASFGENATSLMESCTSLGLISKNEEISQEELSEKAEIIFNELNESYGTTRKMPAIKWALDEDNKEFGGFYKPGIREITIFKPQDSYSALESLTHELSHTWFIDETLNTLSSEETLLRLAEESKDKYTKDNSDKNSGRDACLYGLAANRSILLYWAGIYTYLDQTEKLTSNTSLYTLILDYYLMPGLIMRYAALNDSVETPVIETTRSYNLDISATQGLIEKILLGEEPAGQFPFD